MIKIATTNGFSDFKYWETRTDGSLVTVSDNITLRFGLVFTPEQLMFTPSFAKYLWGENIITDDTWRLDQNGQWITVKLSCWEYHTQKLSIADDRYKYLEEYANVQR